MPTVVCANQGVELRPVQDIEFYLIAEEGILEAQAVLLCESIRRFAGAYASATITAVSPRSSRRPSAHTLRSFDELGVHYLALDVSSCCPEYSTAIRVHVTPIIARRSGPPILVQLDSDTLFVGEPNLNLPSVDIAARPVDVKGMSTTGPGDPIDPYWRDLCTLCGVDYDLIPTVLTTVANVPVRANYNGGLIAVRRDCGVFERTEAFFRRLVASDFKPRRRADLRLRTGTGAATGVGAQFWGTTQAAFSLAITAGAHAVRILPPSHNVPLHKYDQLSPDDSPPIHIHYHWLLNAGECGGNPMFDGRLRLSEDVLAWLKERVPLEVSTTVGSLI